VQGRLAFSIAATELPDLILLDIMMPDSNGYEICSQLKADPRTQNIPIIFVTAKDDEDEEAKGLSIGAIDYIIKPFSLPIVLARVKNHLELKKRGDILTSLASLDGLTGIVNHRSFGHFLEQEWRRTIRNRSYIALILVSIDHFKAYNDHYGHLAGDQCLKQIASTLQNTLMRPADCLARYHGKEFACLLPETNHNGALTTAINLKDSIQELKIPHQTSPTDPYVTLSIGVASTIPVPDSEPSKFIDATKQSMNKAKKNGRNIIKGLEI
jgi:diguanylate cyclase (GGDEF)-like protein